MRVMRFYPQAWPLRTPFVIARGERTEARVVVVDIEQDGLHGIGECTFTAKPRPRLSGKSAASCTASNRA